MTDKLKPTCHVCHKTIDRIQSIVEMMDGLEDKEKIYFHCECYFKWAAKQKV